MTLAKVHHARPIRRNDMTETATKIDEQALRKPGFQGGEPIALADGQSYYFPKPVLEFAPKFGGAGFTASGIVTSLGPEFDRLTEAYDAACEASRSGDTEHAGPRPLDVTMGLAIHMLRLNYDLADDQLALLLRWRPDNEESDLRWSGIMNVARGLDAPKTQPVG
jgi:hypothetical protein